VKQPCALAHDYWAGLHGSDRHHLAHRIAAPTASLIAETNSYPCSPPWRLGGPHPARRWTLRVL